ncbi:MAG: hypothetical protein L0191_13050, partial [Acidobacteria bacterium]|nr:hypothetical protein [Acidobacteriota bacterium]
MSLFSRTRLPAFLLLPPAIAIAVAVFAASIVPLSAQEDSQSTPEQAPGIPEFLKTVSEAPRALLVETLALRPAVVDKIMAHREAGGTFKSIGEFRAVTAIDGQELLKVLEVFRGD